MHNLRETLVERKEEGKLLRKKKTQEPLLLSSSCAYVQGNPNTMKLIYINRISKKQFSAETIEPIVRTQQNRDKFIDATTFATKRWKMVHLK